MFGSFDILFLFVILQILHQDVRAEWIGSRTVDSDDPMGWRFESTWSLLHHESIEHDHGRY